MSTVANYINGLLEQGQQPHVGVHLLPQGIGAGGPGSQHAADDGSGEDEDQAGQEEDPLVTHEASGQRWQGMTG